MTKITITLDLPDGIAEKAEEIHAADPTFLARIVQYGITRREIYRRMESLRESAAKAAAAVVRWRCPTCDYTYVSRSGSDNPETFRCPNHPTTALVAEPNVASVEETRH